MGNSKETTANENKHYYDIKTGLKESMININKTLDNIKNWDELINLKEESIEDNIIKRSKTIKRNYSDCCQYLCIFCGALSVLFQLITVQGCIIILNSLFDEIVEEFKLWLNNTKRVHNFYEHIEINSYKELPEIDVGMITSSVGIIFLKNSGFICSNITFQLLSLIWLLLLFLLFDFHSDNKLLENYTRLEIVVLVLSYIGLSFLVGCSSTIGLKEFTDKYFFVYKKRENLLFKALKKITEEEMKESEEKTEKLLLFLFSGASIFIIMQINRKIFTSFDNITSKWILKWIIIVSFLSFGLSMAFNQLFSLPIKTKKDYMKRKFYNTFLDLLEEEEISSKTSKKELKREEKENKEDNKDEEKNKEDKEDKIEKEKNKNKENNKEKENKENKNKENNKEEEKENQDEDKKENILTINKIKNENEDKNYINTEKASIKMNQSFPQNQAQIEEIRISKIESENKNKIYSTKICTLCGYIYIRKKTVKKSACICYYYTNMCTWFKEKICNAEIITAIIIEFFCQICIIGFNPILTEKLLNEYSYSKAIKFYIALIILSFFFGIIIFYECTLDMVGSRNSCDKIFDYFQLSFIFLIAFIIFTFICSICYLCDDNLSRERWNNIIMTEFIFFKILDFQILTFFDFFDNSDIFNTTLAITLEKLIWMIVETIIEAFVEDTKILVIIQIVITSIALIFITFCIIIIILVCKE